MSVTATAVDTPTGYTNVCELPASTHDDIVDFAVKSFTEDYKYKLSQKGGNR